jgi:hypothetical protein
MCGAADVNIAHLASRDTNTKINYNHSTQESLVSQCKVQYFSGYSTYR